MTRYVLGTLPYADRHRVLDVLDDAIERLDRAMNVNVTIEGGCEVLVVVTPPPERIGTHEPETQDNG